MTLLDALEEDGGLSLEQLLGMDDSGDKEEFEFQKTRAEDGRRDAMLWIGIRYLKGDIVPQDAAEGIYWLMESDSEIGFNDIGDFFEKQGDYAQAESWYLKAAQMEAEYSYMAYNSLSTLFLRPDNADIEKASYWTLRSLKELYNIPEECKAIEGYVSRQEQFVFGCAKVLALCYKDTNPEKAEKWQQVVAAHEDEEGEEK